MRIQVDGDTVKLYGVIWEGDGAYISNELERLEGNGTLYIRLHTPGGDVMDGNLIYNTVKVIAAKREVIWIIDGLAASMGSILITSGTKVWMARNAFIMTHAPQGAARGTAKEFKSLVGLLESMEKNFISIYAEKTGKTEKDIKTWLEGDNWFDADKSKTVRLVDRVVDPVLEDTDMKALRELKLTAMLDNPKAEHKSFDLPNSLVNPNRPKQQSPTDQTNIDNNNNKEMDKQALILAFNLQGVTAESSDTAILQALQAQFKVVEDKATEATGKLQTFEDKQKVAEKEAITSSINGAVAVGKIQDSQRANFENIGNTSGLQALNTVFESMQPRQSLSGQLGAGGSAVMLGVPEDRKAWAWDQWQEKDGDGLQALLKGDDNAQNAFKALFKAKFNKEYKE